LTETFLNKKSEKLLTLRRNSGIIDLSKMKKEEKILHPLFDTKKIKKRLDY